MLAVVLLSGCVAHIPKAEQSPDLSYRYDDKIIISVIDERYRVKSGKPENYIGVAHGLFGIPTDMYVYPWVAHEEEKKNQTLAQALEERIVFGLEDEGWDVVGGAFASRPSEQKMLGRLRAEAAKTLLILTLKKWYVDINLNWVTAFILEWNVTVDTFDRDAKALGSTSVSGRDTIDEDASDSFPNMIRRAYRDRLARILEEAEVREALAVVPPS
jgi:hypothetical protein